jgi:hypothetical protein
MEVRHLSKFLEYDTSYICKKDGVMRKNIFILVLILSSISYAQNFEMAFLRIEQAFRTASPSSLWPLISSGMSARIEDSLYQEISSIQSESILKEFIQNKDSIEFRFATKFAYCRNAEGNGVMTYVSDRKKESINVDVYLFDFKGETFISAIDISNSPSPIVFYNLLVERNAIK